MNTTGKDNYRHIQVTVAELQAMARGRLRHEGLVCAMAATALALLIGVVTFMFLPPEGWMRLSLALVWLASTAGLLWWRLIGPWRTLYRDLPAVGTLIEAHFPEFRNDVTASLQFVAELDDLRREQRVSVTMVEGLLAKTQTKLDSLRHKLHEALPDPRVGLAYGITIGALTLLLGLGVFAPDSFRLGVRGLVFGPAPLSVDDTTRRISIVGDIRLRYQYPDYTNLGERTIQNSTGDIEVLRGTEIEFEAVALHKVNKAELVITLTEGTEAPEEEGKKAPAGPRRVLLQRRPGGRLVANFPALRDGTYIVEAELATGERVVDGITREIRVLPDESPRVKVLSPEGEVDVSPEDSVTFTYEASDDFGLTEIAIVTAFAGDDKNQKRTVIQTTNKDAKVLPGDARPTIDEARGSEMTMKGETLLDLLPYSLKPKDRLVVHIEAIDNDTTEGPKITASSPIILRVSSPEDKHLEIIDAQEKIFEALLDVLADYLESPIGTRYQDPRGDTLDGIPNDWSPSRLSERFDVALPPHRKAGGILGHMLSLMERMTQDPLMLKRDYELFRGTHESLKKLHDVEGEMIQSMRLPAKGNALSRLQLVRLFKARERTVHGTERAIITIEDLIASQRMENALETAKDLKEAVERLKELMKKYKETKDPALKEEIMREMQRLQARMKEMMEKMRAQLKNLPQEHMNMEALDREGMMNKASESQDAMEEMMKALEKGDIDKAMEMLSKMSQNVDDMLSQMQEEFDEMQPDGLSALDKRVSELMDELNNLQAQEQDLAKKTDEINKEMAEAQKERVDKMIDEFAEKELEKVRDLKKRLDNMDTSKLDPMDRTQVDRLKKDASRLEKALESKDMAEALEEANKLAQNMQNADTSLGFRTRFMPGSDPRKKPYRDAQNGVRRNKPKAEEIARDLKELLEQARPRPNAEQAGRLKQMSGQQQKIRERTEKMSEQLAKDGEFPMLQQELGPGLEEAQQFMEGAQKRLQKGEGKPAHENEKLAMDKLKGLKQSLKKALKEEKMGQGKKRGKQMSKEKVEIPGEGARAPKEFREDIMDAMKEGSLDQYQDELRQYYESLVR